MGSAGDHLRSDKPRSATEGPALTGQRLLSCHGAYRDWLSPRLDPVGRLELDSRSGKDRSEQSRRNEGGYEGLDAVSVHRRRANPEHDRQELDQREAWPSSRERHNHEHEIVLPDDRGKCQRRRNRARECA